MSEETKEAREVAKGIVVAWEHVIDNYVSPTELINLTDAIAAALVERDAEIARLRGDLFRSLEESTTLHTEADARWNRMKVVVEELQDKLAAAEQRASEAEAQLKSTVAGHVLSEEDMARTKEDLCGDATSEVLKMATLFRLLQESTDEHSNELSVDGFYLRSEEAKERAALYERAYWAVCRIWPTELTETLFEEEHDTEARTNRAEQRCRELEAFIGGLVSEAGKTPEALEFVKAARDVLDARKIRRETSHEW